MNNNKDSDKTYIVAWCDQTHGDVLTNREVKKVNLVDRYEVCDSYSDAIELYNQVRDRDYCYSANITQVIESTDYHQTRAAKIVDKPKKITNDFDHWITELDTTAQNMADWLSSNTENFEEEPNIDSARTTIQEAVQLIQENNIVAAVVGLPLHMNGDISKSSQSAENFALLVEQECDIPVLMWDERLSTTAAESSMFEMRTGRQKRMSKKDSKKAVDSVAASLILQSVLPALPK